MNFCFAVANNVVPVEDILEIHNVEDTLTEEARYNTSIWCHKIPGVLKICMDNLTDVNNGFTWMKCFTQGCHEMANVGNLK